MGERYAAACRHILQEMEQADQEAASERMAPQGVLNITAPVSAGEELSSPILDEFMDTFPDVTVQLQFLDRAVNLIDEGVDVALRIAHLRDSNQVAVRLGDVRTVLAAPPSYLDTHAPIDDPTDLASSGGHHLRPKSGTQSMERLSLIVEYETKPGTLAEFLEIMRAQAKACLAEEPDCLRFEVLRPVDESGDPIANRVMAPGSG